jgi:NAD(P) transhydrogenase
MIGRRTTATDLPQTVAALHSVVGLAAVLTSIGSVLAHVLIEQAVSLSRDQSLLS